MTPNEETPPPVVAPQRIIGLWTLHSLGVGAAAAVLYGLTLCRFPYPVESAAHLARHTGLDPFRTLLDPVWGAWIQGTFALGGDRAVLLANALSIPFAVLTLILLFYVVANTRHEEPVEVPVVSPAERRACLLSAWTAVAFFGTSAPFWFVATRAHPASWNLLLLSTVAALLVSARLNQRPAYLLPAAFLAGGVSATMPAMVWLLPVFAGYVGLRLFLQQWLSLRRVLLLGVCFALGVVAVLPFLVPYLRSEVFEWREFAGFGHLAWIYLRDHMWAVRATLAGHGWMLAALTLVLPWLAAIVWPAIAPQHRLNESAAFHLVLLALAVVLVLDLQLSPWAMLQLERLMVVPYLLGSVWIAHVAGYWWIKLHEAPYAEMPGRLRLRRSARALFLPCLAALGLAGAWQHGRIVRPAAGRPAAVFAEQAVAALPDNAWLVSNGILDANLALAAHQKHRTVHLLNPARAAGAAYARYLESLADSPRLHTMAEVGLVPMLAELVARGDHGKVAMMEQGAFWQQQGFEALPERGAYRGWRKGEGHDVDASFIYHEGFWVALETTLSRAHGAPRPVNELNEWLADLSARMANDLGVFWENLARPDMARIAYDAALRLEPANVSSLLNALSLAEKEKRPEVMALQERIRRVLESRTEAVTLWELAQRYGVVRHPEAYAERGWLWARSGRLDAAIRDLEQAASTDAHAPKVQMALASLYFQKEEDAQSRQYYQSALLDQPENTSALLGLGRIAMRSGDFAGAEALFHRVLELNPGSPVAATELGILSYLSGKMDEAEDRLQNVVEVAPGSVRALYLLGLMAAGRGDAEATERWEAKLAELDTAEAALARASIVMEGGRLSEARRLLEPLAARSDTRGGALRLLLQIDTAEGTLDAADARARAILEMDVGDPLANLILGSIQYSQGRLPEAEASFRAVLRRQPSAEAHNSLAWLLAEQGDLPEGLVQAREALRLEPKYGPAWDTLGVILHRMERPDQAVVALRKGVEYYPVRWDFKLHLAEALHDSGDLEASRDLARELVASSQGVSSNLLDRANALLAEAK